jgi:hypothetical protein
MGAALTLSLVQQAAQMIPGHAIAFDRGVPVNLVRQAAGVELTLERAYVDPNQLVLAFSAAGEAGQAPRVPRADVVDADGRHYLEFAGADVADADTSGSGSVLAFDVPPGIGESVELTVTVDVLIPVSTDRAPAVSTQLVYQFSLPVHPATKVNVDETVTVSGRAITLRWLRVSPTAVRLRLDTDLAELATPEHPRWTVEATLRSPDGDAERLTWMAFPPECTCQPKSQIGPILDALDGSVELLQSTSGKDSATGTWTVTVDRLVGFDGKGGHVTVQGPWNFEVSVP